MGKQVVEIDGLDLFDVISFISRKNRKFIAIILAETEEILGKDSEEFKLMRKIILDGFNDYTRSVVTLIFGDIEYRIGETTPRLSQNRIRELEDEITSKDRHDPS